MAKRELIDKKEFLKQIDTINLSEFNCNYILNGLDKAKVNEQEIVKPYIVKLKANINEMDLNRIATEYEDRFYGFQSEVLQLIENLLSEQEGQE